MNKAKPAKIQRWEVSIPDQNGPICTPIQAIALAAELMSSGHEHIEIKVVYLTTKELKDIKQEFEGF